MLSMSDPQAVLKHICSISEDDLVACMGAVGLWPEAPASCECGKLIHYDRGMWRCVRHKKKRIITGEFKSCVSTSVLQGTVFAKIHGGLSMRTAATVHLAYYLNIDIADVVDTGCLTTRYVKKYYALLEDERTKRTKVLAAEKKKQGARVSM